MGRGRAKAKQTKVARRLKYYSPDTDLDALQRELSSGQSDSPSDEYDEYEDTYAVEPEADADEGSGEDYDDYAEWAAGRS